ncbi:MAG: site-2 protease family protein [Gammaproteobacteria bacterium]|nr:site-2 protease family protein [Gammaproteobacteria bacterium]
MSDYNTIQLLAVIALPLLFAITLHEFSHGWVAYKLGDPTPKMLGRLTLNPLRHIDPVGTIVFPLMMFLLSTMAGGSPLIFGLAKPVPITPQNLRNIRRDMAWVAIAGPASNLLMAIMWALVAKFSLAAYEAGQGWFALPLISMSIYGILINLVLMVFNLFPIPPLDGGRVLTSVLPGPVAWKLSRIEPYGIMIVLAVVIFGGWELIMQPIIGSLMAIMKTLFALPF